MSAPRSFASLLIVSMTACGGSNNAPDAPGALLGSWRLTSLTVAGSTTGDASLDGALVITATEYALAIASPPAGLIASYQLGGDGTTLVLSDGSSVPFTLAAGAPQVLTLQTSAGTLRFEPASTTTYPDSYPVTGTVTLAEGSPAMTAPRVALIFLTRSDLGFNNDPRDDVPLVFNGKSATFDLSRTRAALGTERLEYGSPQAGIAVSYVVVYDDRDQSWTQQSGGLDELAACSASTHDCIRGVAPLALAYRDGMSPELAASAFAYLGVGWTTTIPATDRRGGKTQMGLISGDATKQPPFDVTVPVDPAQVVIPKLDLTVPQVK